MKRKSISWEEFDDGSLRGSCSAGGRISLTSSILSARLRTIGPKPIESRSDGFHNFKITETTESPLPPEAKTARFPVRSNSQRWLRSNTSLQRQHRCRCMRYWGPTLC